MLKPVVMVWRRRYAALVRLNSAKFQNLLDMQQGILG